MEIDSFADLVAESRLMSDDWHIVLVGCIAGRGGRAPTSADAEESGHDRALVAPEEKRPHYGAETCRLRRPLSIAL